jgi:hypothetical protein
MMHERIQALIEDATRMNRILKNGLITAYIIFMSLAFLGKTGDYFVAGVAALSMFAVWSFAVKIKTK